MAITEDLNEIKDILKKSELEKDENNKNKKKWTFKIPKRARVTRKQARDNYITVIKINDNGELNFKRVLIENQTFMDEGIPRLVSLGYILHYRNKPVVLMPSWSVKPLNLVEEYDKSLKDGSNAKGYKILMEKMLISNTGEKKKSLGGGIKWIVLIGLAAIVIYALVTGV